MPTGCGEGVLEARLTSLRGERHCNHIRSDTMLALRPSNVYHSWAYSYSGINKVHAPSICNSK